MSSSKLSPWTARIVAKGRGDKERRAEFQFVTGERQNFEFLTQVQGSYNNVTGTYDSMDRGPFDVPEDVFKVYGFNWTNDGKGIQLEAIWEIGKEEKRDLVRDEFQAIEKATEGAKSDKFGEYKARELYFSWPEFVLIAQFVLQEFVFEALHIRPEDRPKKRAAESNPHLSPDAYDFTRRNCQDYCRMLLNKMSENEWHDPERLNYTFSLTELEKEWRSHDNSWAKGKKWGQKQLVNNFVSARGADMLEYEVVNLKPMSSRDAMKMWKDLLDRGQKPMRGPRSDEVLLGLLIKLDHCGLAIELASAYVLKNQTPIADSINLLADAETEMNQNELIRTWFHESEKRLRILLSRGKQIPVRAVALIWLTSFKAIEKISRASQHSDVTELLLFVACLSPSDIPSSFFRYAASNQKQHPADLLADYAFPKRRGHLFDMHTMVQLGKAYVENGDKSSCKLAIPVLTEVYRTGTRSTPKDQLLYVSEAMANLVISYNKLYRDDEAYDIMKKKQKLDSYLGGRHNELPDWLPARSG